MAIAMRAPLFVSHVFTDAASRYRRPAFCRRPPHALSARTWTENTLERQCELGCRRSDAPPPLTVLNRGYAELIWPRSLSVAVAGMLPVQDKAIIF